MEHCTTVKRYRWIIIAALLVSGVIAVEYAMSIRVVPPADVKTLEAFLHWQPSARQFAVVEVQGGEHLIAYGQKSGMLPSGPSAYVFDRSGTLVDWSRDVGDNWRFAERWHAQSPDKWLSCEEVDNWPTTRAEE
jgi:hypothetical protein